MRNINLLFFLRIEIRNNEKEIDKITRLISNIHECLNEIKSHIDNFLLREKTLEKNFKKEFADVNPIVQEQIQKLYK